MAMLQAQPRGVVYTRHQQRMQLARPPRLVMRRGTVSCAAGKVCMGISWLQQQACQPINGSSKVQKLNAEELEVALATRDKPLIIDFMATWCVRMVGVWRPASQTDPTLRCGPCLLMAQELEKVAEEMGDSVRIVKVDTDEEPDLSTQLQIQGLPTLVYVGVGDKPALRTEGLLPAATIKEIITEELMGAGSSSSSST